MSTMQSYNYGEGLFSRLFRNMPQCAQTTGGGSENVLNLVRAQMVEFFDQAYPLLSIHYDLLEESQL